MTVPSLRLRYVVDPVKSAVLLHGSSNVGSIAFGTTGVTGWMEMAAGEGVVDVQQEPKVHLEVPLAGLTSGNALYDAELQQRLDVRRFPRATVAMESAVLLGAPRYRVGGTVTLHGVGTPMQGNVDVTFLEPGTVQVVGEQVIDIRDFDIDVPSVLMLRLFPQVRVQLQVLARQADGKDD